MQGKLPGTEVATDLKTVAVAKSVADFDDDKTTKATEQHFLEEDLNPMVALTRLIKRALYIPEHATTAVAAWILFSWKYKSFEIAPILFFHSPTKRCGKTTAEELLEKLVPNPLLISNTSSAVLFRLVDSGSYTLLIDEFDSFGKENRELKNILNAGYRSSGVVMRCKGQDANFEPKGYRVFCPKVIASIGYLPDTIMDRSIIISMERMLDTEKLEKLRDLKSECEDVRALCELWTEYAELPSSIDLPDFLNSRQQDSWEPLFSVVKTCGDRWLRKVYEAAQIISREFVEETQDHASQLLADVHGIFIQEDSLILPGPLICRRLNENDLPYSDWNDGGGITASTLAKKLKLFKLKSESRQGTRGYLKAKIEIAAKRYLPHLFKSVAGVASVVHDDKNSNTSATATLPETVAATCDPWMDAWELEGTFKVTEIGHA